MTATITVTIDIEGDFTEDQICDELEECIEQSLYHHNFPVDNADVKIVNYSDDSREAKIDHIIRDGLLSTEVKSIFRNHIKKH